MHNNLDVGQIIDDHLELNDIYNFIDTMSDNDIRELRDVLTARLTIK